MDRMNDTLAKIARRRMAASTGAPAGAEQQPARRSTRGPRSTAQQPTPQKLTPQKPARSGNASRPPAGASSLEARHAAAPRAAMTGPASASEPTTALASSRRRVVRRGAAASAAPDTAAGISGGGVPASTPPPQRRESQRHEPVRSMQTARLVQPAEPSRAALRHGRGTHMASAPSLSAPPASGQTQQMIRPRQADVAAQAEPPSSSAALDMDRILEMPARGARAVREPRRPYAPDVLPVEAVEAVSARSGTGPSFRYSQDEGPRDRSDRGDWGNRSVSRRSWSGMSSLGDSLADLVADLTERRKRRARMGGGDGGNGGGSGEKPEPAPACPICGGAGYVRLDVPVGDPRFGQPVPCKCKERELAERERMEDERRIAGLDRYFSLKPFHDKTFETFQANAQGVEEAYSAALSFAQDPAQSPYHWLVLIGETGVGKTHLAAAIAHRRLAAQDPVFFAIVPDLLDHLRSAFAPSAEVPYDEMFETIRDVETLVLDDLGAENSTAWATEKLFQIINHRYNYRMPTVVTTNQQMFERMDARIASRLSDPSLSRVVTINARSRRPRTTRTPPPRNAPPRW